MFAFIKRYLERLLLSERSSQKLAASFSVGTFIACTPTIPFQTPLLFVVSWLFGLNAAIMFSAVYIINNPFTMIPIYIIGYAIGAWFFERLLHISLMPYNPAWVTKFNAFISKYIAIEKYLGSGFCLWYLLFGGFLFALLVSVPMYPLLKYVCDRLIAQLEKRKTL